MYIKCYILEPQQPTGMTFFLRKQIAYSFFSLWRAKANNSFGASILPLHFGKPKLSSHFSSWPQTFGLEFDTVSFRNSEKRYDWNVEDGSNELCAFCINITAAYVIIPKRFLFALQGFHIQTKTLTIKVAQRLYSPHLFFHRPTLKIKLRTQFVHCHVNKLYCNVYSGLENVCLLWL